MDKLHWRADELKHHAKDIAWLDADEARSGYDLVGLYDSKSHYGLNAQTVSSVERLEFGDDIAMATGWLRPRMASVQDVVVVFGRDDCFRCSGNFFIENWSDIFVPSRDDAMVYSPDSSIILFYCHENEFEVGQRRVFD
jgi:hypothetical protein